MDSLTREKNKENNRSKIELDFHYLLLILFLLINGGLGDTVKIPLTSLGDTTTTLILIVLKDTDLLEGLEDATVDGAGGIDVVVGAGAAVLGRTVDLPQTANTDGLAEVDVTGDSGGTNVVPG